MTNKYETLYLLAKEAFASEIDRLARVERKASNLLSVLTLLIGLYLTAIQWIGAKVIPPSGCLDWAIIVISVAALAALVISWAFVFRVFTIDKRRTIVVNDDVCRFFDDTSTTNVYFAMARRFSGGIDENAAVVKRKVGRLTCGYWAIMLAGILIVVLAVMVGGHAWLSATKDSNDTTCISTGDKK